MSTPSLVMPLSPEQPLPAPRNDPPGYWPRDILEAYARYRGPYTIENAETILEEEPVELYHGWLVWQEMTDAIERRVVATLQAMLDLSARKAGFGQGLPDQLECLLSDGSVVKPDASLISWSRFQTEVRPHGPRQRPTLIGGPELVVEIRSPSNWRAQERRKRRLYFANNVHMVWDVDAVRQLIWVYQATAPTAPRQYGIDDDIDCAPLLPSWRRRVTDIFAEQATAEAVAGEVAHAWVAEGRAEGRAETLREVLPLLVQGRFGMPLPTEASARLAQCPLTQLQRLQMAAQTCASLEEWLRVLASASPRE